MKTSYYRCFSLLSLLVLFLSFGSCSSSDKQNIERLNDISYSFHYRNIDSTEYYARQAIALATTTGSIFNRYNDEIAEAYNNLAFASIMRMNYDLASQQLDSTLALTDNQLEILVANVQNMRLCQRRSRNKEFYDYREHAMKAIQRINEERASLDNRQII